MKIQPSQIWYGSTLYVEGVGIIDAHEVIIKSIDSLGIVNYERVDGKPQDGQLDFEPGFVSNFKYLRN